MFRILASTVGYGDFTPKTQEAKAVAIVFIPLAVGCMGQWLSILANWIVESRSSSLIKRTLQQQARQQLTLADLDLMDGDKDGTVSRAEFLELMLVAMNKIDKDLLETLREYFDRLDVDGTGTLTKEDLLQVARNKFRSPRYKLKLSGYKHHLLQQGNRDARNSSSWGGFFNGGGQGGATSGFLSHDWFAQDDEES